MRPSHGAETHTSNNHSRHYESCVNATCSRSPSPVRRQLWEPKHPPPDKLRENKKVQPSKNIVNDSTNTNNLHARDEFPFFHRHNNGEATITSAIAKRNPPLFTYSINNGVIEKGTKSLEVTIQQHKNKSSPPSSRSKSPEPRVLQPRDHKEDLSALAGNNLTSLKLDLEKSTVPEPTLLEITSTPPLSQSVPTNVPSVSGSIPSCPTPLTIGVLNSKCKACISCPSACSSPRLVEQCDVSVSACQPCSSACHCVTCPRSTEDRATSPSVELSCCRTPQGVGSCELACEPCPFLSLTPRSNVQDKATSPAHPSSSSPTAEINIHTPLHSRGGSISSEHNTIVITNPNNSQVKIEVGSGSNIKLELPTSYAHPGPRYGSDDQIHSHNPKLEAFYTSSCSRSQSPSPTSPPSCLKPTSTDRSYSASSPLSERQASSRSRSIEPRPKWNPCPRLEDFCPSLKHSTSTSTSPRRSSSSPFTSRSRSGSPPKTPSTKGASTYNSLSTPQTYECRIEEPGHPDRNSRSLSPSVTVTPRGTGSGQVTIQWASDPPSGSEYEEFNPVSVPRNSCLKSKHTYEECESLSSQDLEETQHDYEIQVPASHTRPIVRVITHPGSTHSMVTSSSAAKCVTPSCCPGPTSKCGYTCCCCCCQGKCKDVEGINKCPALPPHLQSDWSASLRSPPTKSKTKPILYLDPQGHEHIMFADGTIEHLSHHCQPVEAPRLPPSPPPQAPPLSPSRAVPHPSGSTRLLNHDTSQNMEQYCPRFAPRCGDVVIREHRRLASTHAGKDDGQVAFFTSGYVDLQEGDAIVRLGKFNSSGKWCSWAVVEMYLKGSHGQWMFLGTHEGHECLQPLDANQHQTVRTPNKQLQLRLGDLLIHTVPNADKDFFYFWNPTMKFNCDQSPLLLRMYIGRPRVVDEHHNKACCVPTHLPVGYAELYVKVNSFWLFLGRDHHMFKEQELLDFS